jgi:hypothetical protein
LLTLLIVNTINMIIYSIISFIIDQFTFLLLLRDKTLSRILYFTTAGVKYCVAAVKSCLFSTSCLSGSLIPTLLIVYNRVSLKPPLGGLRNVALSHFPLFTDSKRRLCNVHVIFLWLMLPRDDTLSGLFFLNIIHYLIIVGLDGD